MSRLESALSCSTGLSTPPRPCHGCPTRHPSVSPATERAPTPNSASEGRGKAPSRGRFALPGKAVENSKKLESQYERTKQLNSSVCCCTFYCCAAVGLGGRAVSRVDKLVGGWLGGWVVGWVVSYVGECFRGCGRWPCSFVTSVLFFPAIPACFTELGARTNASVCCCTVGLVGGWMAWSVGVWVCVVRLREFSCLYTGRLWHTSGVPLFIALLE